jgi:hypothetical protein
VLSPDWFINVDARGFAFRNVKWRRERIAEQIDRLWLTVASRHSLLSTAYRELALNVEESHRYEEASHFRYRSMELRRRERLHGFGFWRLDWWYWFASG